MPRSGIPSAFDSMKKFLFARFTALVLAAASTAFAADMPEWLWFEKTDGTDIRFFRKVFSVQGRVSKAELVATADDKLEVFLKGERVLQKMWARNPVRAARSRKSVSGQNVPAIRAENRASSPAAAFAKLEITSN